MVRIMFDIFDLLSSTNNVGTASSCLGNIITANAGTTLQKVRESLDQGLLVMQENVNNITTKVVCVTNHTRDIRIKNLIVSYSVTDMLY